MTHQEHESENTGSTLGESANHLETNLNKEEGQSIQKRKIHYIYKILNIINNKVYIGQTVQPQKRWHQHKCDSRKKFFSSAISAAMKKYGIENFEFKVIACCIDQDSTNLAEAKIIEEHDCLIQNGKGYNIALGGNNAPKSEIWKQSMRDYWKNLSEEDKKQLCSKISDATKNQIETRGHPAQGHVWSEESKAKLSNTLRSLDKDQIYTPEVRQRMSEAHVGKTLPREQVKKMAAAIKANWDKRNAERYANEEIWCHADGCEVSGKVKYRIVNQVRYCVKHACRVLATGQTELLPRKPVEMTEEIRKKISLSKTGKNLGREPHNKAKLTHDQIQMIVNDPRSIMELSKAMNIGRKIICRIRKESRK